MDTKQKKPAPSRRGSQTTSSSRTGTHTGSKKTGTRRQSPAAKSAARERTTASHTGQRTQTRQPAPEVVYTPAKPFSRNRFLLKLLTVAAVVIAIVFGISIFFKVETFVVSGNDKYSAWQIREASGLQEGDNLLTFSRASASAKIRTALPYVDSVRIGIKLPDAVMIDVVELDVAYAMEADDGTWWLITAEGRVVEQINESAAAAYTNILGVYLSGPQQSQPIQAVSGEPTTNETLAERETEPMTVGTDPVKQLETALAIAQYLESNGIIGEAASVDVSKLNDLQLWYGQRYQVKLGDASELSYKIECMKQMIEQLGEYESGVLDISFTIWPDQPSYDPF